jgi:8-amino-7-oxononanoate synthase
MGVHHELEDALAQFVGRPRALLFGSGYAANMGAIGALAGPGDAVFQDRLNHASLLDGGWLSRADFIWFRHADVADLRAQIAARKHKGRLLIVSDGTFSMDGDLCPLAELVTVAKESGAWLMIDDAHGMGAMGPGGIGNVDGQRFGPDDVQVLVGTLGKAFGTCGAFVAGTEDLIEYLIQRARQYIFTTAIPPAVAAATLKSLEIVRTEGWRREHLHELISRFRAGATSLGLTLAASTGAIQPVIVGDAARTVTLSRELEQRGFLITAIRPPTVPVGTSRLRITLTAAHTTGDVDALLAALADVIKPQRGVC